MFRRAVTNACSKAPVAAASLTRSQLIRPSVSSFTPSARLPSVTPVAVRGYHEKDKCCFWNLLASRFRGLNSRCYSPRLNSTVLLGPEDA